MAARGIQPTGGGDVNSEEDPTLWALALMAQQYLECSDGALDHLCMCAGEEALRVLHDKGLVTDFHRGARWTAEGQALLGRR